MAPRIKTLEEIAQANNLELYYKLYGGYYIQPIGSSDDSLELYVGQRNQDVANFLRGYEYRLSIERVERLKTEGEQEGK